MLFLKDGLTNLGYKKMESWANEHKLAKGRSIIVLHTYWTNFNRLNPTVFEILPCNPVGTHADEVYRGLFWWFKTNLELSDFATWDEGRKVVFLKQMWDIYRYRKAS